MTRGCVIFDFDGTLVDSAPGILSSITLALAAQGIESRVPLVSEIIGPPLLQTLALVSGIDTPADLAELTTEFKRFYDQEAYRDTIPYPGIDGALRELHQAGIPLHIATNKRARPTRLILDHLGWTTLFESVYCLDENPDCSGKTEMLGKQLKEQSITSGTTLYVGDTNGDALAAKSNHIPFLHVAWGYGSGSAISGAASICTDARQLSATLYRFLHKSQPCPAN